MKYIAAALGLVVMICATAWGQGDFGLGIIVGEPTGLSGKLWLSKTSALDAAAAWSFEEEASVHLHMDYLLHNFDVIRVDKGKLPIYYGIGGRLKLKDDNTKNNDDVKIGVRIPVGLEYIFPGEHVDLFLEIVPLLDLVPETEFGLNGGIGVRYFF